MSEVPAIPEKAPSPANFPDDFDYPDDDLDGLEDDPGAECGRWNNGRLGGSCSLAGTEWCDWECPYSR